MIGGMKNLSYEKGCARTVHIGKETNEGEYDKDTLNPVWCNTSG